MPYTLYTTDGCKSCERAADHLIASHVRFQEINLSRIETERPQGVIVVPALFRNGVLLAYGPDIMTRVPVQ